MNRFRRGYPARCKGFSLLEVLVATFIFAVAIAALLKVMGSGASSLHQLEQRQFALLSAHNQMVLAQLEQGGNSGQVENGGFRYNWRWVVHPTEDKRLQRIELSLAYVDEQGEEPEVQLTGFREVIPR